MWTRVEGHALIVDMETTTMAAADGLDSLPPAGRLIAGGCRFYGWAPDPERRGTHRLSVHERDPRTGRRADRDLDRWFGSYEEAEAFVTRIKHGREQGAGAMREQIARKIERLDARPCLSPEEEAALLDYLMHEEEEIVRMPPPGTPFTLIEVEPPPKAASLSDALYRTAEEMRRAGALDRVLGKARGLNAGRKAGPR